MLDKPYRLSRLAFANSQLDGDENVVGDAGLNADFGQSGV